MARALAEELGAVSAAEAIAWFNILVYGDPGAGKTRLAASAQDHPSTSPVLFLDIEGGTASIRHRGEIDVAQVRNTKQFVAAYERLEADAGKTYKTVVVDSLSELQKLDMEDIMRQVARDNPKMDEEVPSQREYLKSQVHIRKLVRAFRDLPCNTIFTSLMRIDQDPKTMKVSQGPNFSRKLAGEIAGFVDVVAYLDVITNEDGQQQRRLLLSKTEKTLAKDRLGIGAGEPLVFDPTIPVLWNNLQVANTNS
jgi:phage nucleotide-binding protein